MLKYGAVTVDFLTGYVYGDIDHCPLNDLIESAKTLINIAPKRAKAIGKAYDNDCYLYGCPSIDTSQIPLPDTACRVEYERDKVRIIKMHDKFLAWDYNKVIAFVEGARPILSKKHITL